MNSFIYRNHLVCKRFGQNFLNDRYIIDRIVVSINPQRNQAFVEIGPGLAALTEPMSKHLDHLTVIELDHNLAARLKIHPFLSHKLTIYQQDAMTINFGDLSEKLGRSLRIFGSLPYNVSTPLIFHLFKYANVITDMYFILQKELVDRMLAKPNSKAYGRLSVITQYYCQVSSILRVSPKAFTPSPKVDSELVRMLLHTVFPYPVKDICVLNRITIEAFSQRRKMIRNSLCKLLTSDALIEIGVDPAMRAENISVEQYCRMANYISENMFLRES